MCKKKKKIDFDGMFWGRFRKRDYVMFDHARMQKSRILYGLKPHPYPRKHDNYLSHFKSKTPVQCGVTTFQKLLPIYAFYV